MKLYISLFAFFTLSNYLIAQNDDWYIDTTCINDESKVEYSINEIGAKSQNKLYEFKNKINPLKYVFRISRFNNGFIEYLQSGYPHKAHYVFYPNGVPQEITYSDSFSPQLIYYPDGELKFKKFSFNNNGYFDDSLIVRKYKNSKIYEYLKMGISYDTLKSPFQLYKFSYFIEDSLSLKHKPSGYLWDNRHDYISKLTQLNCVQDIYFENGILKQKSFYKNNLRFGIWLFYDEKGRVLRKEYYENGKLTKCQPCNTVNEKVVIELEGVYNR